MVTALVLIMKHDAGQVRLRAGAEHGPGAGDAAGAQRARAGRSGGDARGHARGAPRHPERHAVRVWHRDLNLRHAKQGRNRG